MALRQFETNNPDKKNMEIYNALRDLIQNQGLQVTALAREFGVSHSSVSQYVNKPDYQSNAVEEAASVFLEKWASKSNSENNTEFKKDLSFILTNDAMAVMGLLDRCAADRELGVIIGHAGTGKTTPILEYCKRNREAVYLRADVSMSAKEVLIELGEKLGEILTYGSLRSMQRKIVKRLRERPRVVIVDEADMLISYTVKKLEVLRTIFDEAKVGLVLSGMPRLKGFLLKGPSLKDNLAQFYSRVGYMHELEGLTREEVSEILNGFNVTEAAKEELMLRATNRAFGGFRRFSKALKRSIALADQRGGQITRDIIREADGLLLDMD